MSIQVKQFDQSKAKQELKKCPKIVRDYVKLVEEHLERQKELTAKAIGKLKEIYDTYDKAKNLTQRDYENR